MLIWDSINKVAGKLHALLKVYTSVLVGTYMTHNNNYFIKYIYKVVVLVLSFPQSSNYSNLSLELKKISHLLYVPLPIY